MWLNFLPIFNKEIQKFGFADIRDAQYHMALYEMLAELNFKHVAILKKRQIASSYYHMAKLINQQWFEPGVTLKIGASLKDYINEKGSWKFLDEYSAFLNEHTAWYRPMSPSTVMMWDKESNFWVLAQTTMPAILSENFFMTNSDNCHKYLLSEDGRDRVAKIHFEMIQQVEAENKV